jgi:regulatory protein
MKKVAASYRGKGRLKRRSAITDDNQPSRLNAAAVTDNKPVALNELHSDSEPADTGTSRQCLNAALRFLKYRPRSEHEVRERLKYRGYESQCIEVTIANLKEKGLIDDHAFSRFWADNRDTFSPRSQRMIRIELRRKGIAGGIIDQIVAPADDMAGAYRAAVRKARILPRHDYQDFRRRLGSFLSRRGFDYGIVAKITAQLWEEGDTGAGKY